MAGDVFGYLGFLGGFFDVSLEDVFVCMVAADFSGAGVEGEAFGGEDVLPDRLAGGVGSSSVERGPEVDFAVAALEVFVVRFSDMLDLFFEGGGKAVGQDSDPVFAALAVSDGDLALFEVDVFDAQAEAFHEPQAASVQQACHEVVDPGEGIEQRLDFIACEHDGEVFWPFCALEIVEPSGVAFKDVGVEEGECVEGLVLG